MASEIACPIVRSDVSCYWKDMWRRLDAMRHLRELCDVSLCADDGLIFMAHSAVLAASSDVLRQLLIAAQASSYGDGCSVVQVSNVNHDVLRVTLDFIYGKTPSSRLDFERLQSGAARLGLPGAYEYCSRRLMEEYSGLWKEIGSASSLIKNSNWSVNANTCPVANSHGQLIDNSPASNATSLFGGETDSSCSANDVFNKSHTSLGMLLEQDNSSNGVNDHFGTSKFYCNTITNMSDTVGNVDELRKNNMPISTAAPFSVKTENQSLDTLMINLSSTDRKDITSTEQIRMYSSAMPCDTSHANLMSQMSFDDLTRASECPHLQRLAGSDCATPSTVENSCGDGDLDVCYDLFGAVPLKKRTRKPLLPLNTPEEESRCVNVNDPVIKHFDPVSCSASVDTNTSTALDSLESSSVVDSMQCLNSSYLTSLFNFMPDRFGAKTDSSYGSEPGINTVNAQQSSVCSTVESSNNLLLSGSSTIDYLSTFECNLSQETFNTTNDLVSGRSTSSVNGYSPEDNVIMVSSGLGASSSVKTVVGVDSFNMRSRCSTRSPLNMQTTVSVALSEKSAGSSLVSIFDQQSNYIPLSANIMTGTSGSFCHETSTSSVDLSRIVLPPAVSHASPEFSSSFSMSTVSSANQCNHATSAYINLDDVSDVLKANGFTEKLSGGQSGNDEAVLADFCNKENGLKMVASSSDSPSSTVRVCAFCRTQTKTERQLKAHIRSTHVTAEGLKRCSLCSSSFAQVTELGRHFETVHCYTIGNELSLALLRLNGNACYFENCSYQNPHADALQRHLHQRHSVGTPTVKCSDCSRAYFSLRDSQRCPAAAAAASCTCISEKSQLHRHTARAHPPRPIPDLEDSSNESSSSGGVTTSSCSRGEQITCPDCSEQMASLYKLQIHQLRAHSKGKLFSCHNCSFKSPRKKDVQAHMLSQHGTAPPGVHVYSCAICTYKCIDKNRFEEHEAMHNGIPRYRCTMCTRVYTTRRGLRTHIKYHSTDRPHSCPTCTASFKVRSKLADHIKLVHIQKGLKPYVCGYCGHATALRGNCNQHIRKSHPNMQLLVVDRMAAQRRTVKDYDYAGIGGDGIQEHRDLCAAGWTELVTQTNDV